MTPKATSLRLTATTTKKNKKKKNKKKMKRFLKNEWFLSRLIRIKKTDWDKEQITNFGNERGDIMTYFINIKQTIRNIMNNFVPVKSRT